LGLRSQRYLAVGGAVRAGGPLFGPLTWELGVEALAPTQQETFSVMSSPNQVDGQTVFTLPSWGLWTGAGIGVRIW
jgi:hypothetical protein